MPVISRAGQALRRDRADFGAGTGLQNLEQREAYGLLNLRVTFHLDVGASPELVEEGPLIGE